MEAIKAEGGDAFHLPQAKLPNSDLFSCLLLSSSPLPVLPATKALLDWLDCEAVYAMFPWVLAMRVWKEGILCRSVTQRRKLNDTDPSPLSRHHHNRNQYNVMLIPWIKNTYWVPFQIFIFDYSSLKHGPISRDVVLAKHAEESCFDLQHQNQTKPKTNSGLNPLANSYNAPKVDTHPQNLSICIPKDLTCLPGKA